MCVYVVRNEATGLYKIGCTGDLRNRLLSLDQRIGQPLRLCWVITSNQSRLLEKEIHRRFAARRRHGEWFALTVEDLAVVSCVSVVNYDDWHPTKDRPADLLAHRPRKQKRVDRRRYRIDLGEVIERIQWTGKLREGERKPA